MPRIQFILTDGRRLDLEVDSGISAMQAAIFNNVPGIEAACGGFCSCATCHVYLESDHSLPAIADDENSMLDGTAAKRDSGRSRLACQIMLTPELEGLVLRVAETQ